MQARHVLSAAVLLALARFSTGGELYRIEFGGKAQIWSQDKPRAQGALLLFRRHPDGALLSVRKSEVERVVAVAFETPAQPALRPGEEKDLGVTARVAPRAEAPAAGTSQPALRPGEAPGGKSLLNPDRDYRPGWDSLRVPGATEPFPASRGDYREGRSYAYPPGSATQASPGDVPKGVPSGEPPKLPD